MKSLLIRLLKKIYLYAKCVYANKVTLFGWVFLVLGISILFRGIRHPFSSEFAEAGLISELVIASTLLVITKLGIGTIKSYVRSYKAFRKRVARGKELNHFEIIPRKSYCGYVGMKLALQDVLLRVKRKKEHRA